MRCLFISLLHAYSIGVLLSLYLYFIFVPYFDLYFSPNVGTTQTDILYSVTSKKQPLISDTFFISKQINDAKRNHLLDGILSKRGEFRKRNPPHLYINLSISKVIHIYYVYRSVLFLLAQANRMAHVSHFWN